MEYKDADSAFPQYKTQPIPGGGVRVEYVGGMSLRDYFAAKAMVQIMASQMENDIPEEKIAGFNELVADYAYRVADAMLKARGSV